MEVKKSSRADLEKGKSMGVLMGLVVGLAVLFVGFEWGTTDIVVVADDNKSEIFFEEEIEITRPEETPPPPPPPPVQEVVEVLQVVDNDADIDQRDILSSEDDQASAQVETYRPDAVVEEEEPSDNEIFVIVEEMPEFPGGQMELMKFIQKNLKYPVVAQENGIQGRVVCTFVINTDGTVVDIEVARGVDPSLDREALRVLKLMPKWKAGKQRGKAVRVKYNVPVAFRLN